MLRNLGILFIPVRRYMCAVTLGDCVFSYLLNLNVWLPTFAI